MSINITDETYKDIIGKKGITVIQFTADWCGPCRTYGPIVNEFAKENEDITVGKINVDSNREVSMVYGIRSIPTTIIFKDSQLITKVNGVQSKDRLKELVTPLL